MEQERFTNGSEPSAGEQTDAGHKSLAEALRLSFLLLSVFMIIVLVLFFFTGLSQVQTNQRGIKLLFGRIQGKGDDRVLDEGLAWSLPEPVGRVEKIPTDKRIVTINDFWFNEKAEDVGRKLSERRTQSGGLRPGWDGALLTGDRALIHIKIKCTYRIGFKDNKPDPDAIIKYVSNVINPDKLVRSAVCNASIRAAATQTVDSILISAKTTGGKAPVGKDKAEEDKFAKFVKEISQARLDIMRSGIRIQSVNIEKRTPPLAAIAAFDDVGKARQEEDKLKNDAISDAREILQRATGDSWKDLVDDPAAPVASDNIPLLRKYALAREDGEDAAARKMLEEINLVLTSDKTTGDADAIIEEAKRYNNSIRLRMEARAKGFNKLIDKFNATPGLMVTRLWTDVEQEIFNSPTIVKYILTPGEKFILRINQDSEIMRKMMNLKYKSKTDKKKRPERGTRRPTERR